MPSLSITPKYEPGPEIGIATPMRMTRSCAVAIADAHTIAPASAIRIASFMSSSSSGLRRIYRKSAVRLFGFDVRLLDDRCPLRHLGLHEGGERLRRAAHRLGALRVQALDY